MKNLETVLKAAADKNRLRILKLLEHKHMCVCELAFILGIKQPSVSRHLRKLKDAGLIESEQEGLWTNYYIKGGSEYARHIIINLRAWLNDDNQIAADLRKAETADRQCLCRSI